MIKKIEIDTPANESLINITQQVKETLKASGVQEGLCVIFSPHTTAALTINSALDPSTPVDIVDEMHRLVPTRVDFKHQYDTPADAAGHIKTSLIGNSLSLIVTNGELVLGSSQSILFYETDGPRPRQVFVRVMNDR